MVLISTITFVLGTSPEFEKDGEYPTVHKVLEIVDIGAMYFFTFEFLLRFICCPRKFKFLTR